MKYNLKGVCSLLIACLISYWEFLAANKLKKCLVKKGLLIHLKTVNYTVYCTLRYGFACTSLDIPQYLSEVNFEGKKKKQSFEASEI